MSVLNDPSRISTFHDYNIIVQYVLFYFLYAGVTFAVFYLSDRCPVSINFLHSSSALSNINDDILSDPIGFVASDCLKMYPIFLRC